MNISGILIAANPAKRQSVLSSLKAMDGLEIRHVLDDGRIVVVMERETTSHEVSAMKEIHCIDGVITALMAYHYFENEIEALT